MILRHTHRLHPVIFDQNTIWYENHWPNLFSVIERVTQKLTLLNEIFHAMNFILSTNNLNKIQFRNIKN